MRIRCAICHLSISSPLIDKMVALTDIFRKLSQHVERNHVEQAQLLASRMAEAIKLCAEVMPWMMLVDEIPEKEIENNARMQWVEEYIEDRTIALMEAIGIGDKELLESLAYEFREDEYGDEARENEEGTDESKPTPTDAQALEILGENSSETAQPADESTNESGLEPSCPLDSTPAA